MKKIIFTKEIPNWKVFQQKKAEMNSLPKNQKEWTMEVYLKSSYLTDAMKEFIQLNKK